MMPEKPYRFKVEDIENEEGIGKVDRSKCLDEWINSVSRVAEPMNLSKDARYCLLHTLVAQRVRIERLIRERDELK